MQKPGWIPGPELQRAAAAYCSQQQRPTCSSAVRLSAKRSRKACLGMPFFVPEVSVSTSMATCQEQMKGQTDETCLEYAGIAGPQISLSPQSSGQKYAAELQPARLEATAWQKTRLQPQR